MTMLTVAVPSKGGLSDSVADMLREAGFRARPEGRDLSVVDAGNRITFYFLRPRDVAVYVGRGDIALGITGRDLALDSGAPVSEALALGFGASTFRYAAPAGGTWSPADLAGSRIATSYPGLVTADLERQGIEAEIVRLDGAVEISVALGVADAIADVVTTGRTLAAHGLRAFGDPICESEAVVIQRVGHPAGPADVARHLIRRLQGVVVAQQYVMVDYDCPRDLLDAAVAVTPGLESPTVSPLRDDGWVAVRALVPRADMNEVIDTLSDLGVKAILASDLRTARL